MCSGSAGLTATLGSLLGNGSSQSSRRSAVGSPVAVHSSTEGLLGGDFWVTNGCLVSSAAAGPARPTSRSAAVTSSSRRVRTIAEPPPISVIARTLPLPSSQECNKQTSWLVQPKKVEYKLRARQSNRTVIEREINFRS